MHLIVRNCNTLGNDIIVTDPHGDLGALRKVLDILGENDRLFLCGDLVDRGPKSLEILRTIKKINAGRDPENLKIYAVRGNHEDIALRALKCSDFFFATQPKDSEINRFLIAFSYDKMIKDPSYETKMDECFKRIFNRLGREAKLYFYDAYHNVLKNGAEWIFKLTKKQKKEVKNFITPLPYYIRVNGANGIPPFDIVHAVPPSEDIIQHLTKNQSQFFSNDKIHEMTWARPITAKQAQERNQTTMSAHGRSVLSILAYVGHNSLEGHKQFYYAERNLINLDAATYYTGAMLVANHTQNKIFYIVTKQIRQKDLADLEACSAAASSVLQYNICKTPKQTYPFGNDDLWQKIEKDILFNASVILKNSPSEFTSWIASILPEAQLNQALISQVDNDYYQLRSFVNNDGYPSKMLGFFTRQQNYAVEIMLNNYLKTTLR